MTGCTFETLKSELRFNSHTARGADDGVKKRVVDRDLIVSIHIPLEERMTGADIEYTVFVECVSIHIPLEERMTGSGVELPPGRRRFNSHTARGADDGRLPGTRLGKPPVSIHIPLEERMTVRQPTLLPAVDVSIHIPLEERMTAASPSRGRRSRWFQFTYRSRSG